MNFSLSTIKGRIVAYVAGAVSIALIPFAFAESGLNLGAKLGLSSSTAADTTVGNDTSTTFTSDTKADLSGDVTVVRKNTSSSSKSESSSHGTTSVTVEGNAESDTDAGIWLKLHRIFIDGDVATDVRANVQSHAENGTNSVKIDSHVNTQTKADISIN